jgi:hypothetical protein
MKWLFNIFGGNRKFDPNKGVVIPHPPEELTGKPLKFYDYGEAVYKCKILYDNAFPQFVDSKLASMPSRDVKHLARWWKAIEDNLIFGGYGYLSEVSDCDDRATLAMAMSRMIYRDVEASLLVVKIGVDMDNPALGIAAGPKHMTNAVYTDNGWYIVEFPTGQYCRLNKYPNPIWRVWSH